MSDNMVYSQMKEKAENADPIGGTLKFIVDKSIVHIDGTGGSNVISEEDKDADCTISTSLEVLLKLKNGEINPMMAVMGGQIKISGDMGLAMKVQSLLS
jgi:putative sterol carrier protein|tara:strand:- start:109 stop:405 length:297 start_codon:yes stop_codon:yes gene_type:complete